MKIVLIMAALAAIGLSPLLQTKAMAESEFSIDNSVHINEKCEHDCKYEGDINQEGTIKYSEETGQPLSDDVLTVDVDHLHGHKVTISAEVLETGAKADKTVEDYDNYYATFHWYQGRAPIGSTYKACVHDEKTDDVTCKTKVHETNPQTIKLDND